jgi:hypothetical protein
MPETRTSRFNMVFSPEERAMLRALAERNGMSEASVLRQLIREAHRDPELLKFFKRRHG